MSLTQILILISRADWSDNSEWYCRTVHCFQNIWFNKRTHPNEHWNRHQLQQNGHWAATNHLSGRGLVQPIKELSSAAGQCAGKGCALIKQLANYKCTHKNYWRDQSAPEAFTQRDWSQNYTTEPNMYLSTSCSEALVKRRPVCPCTRRATLRSPGWYSSERSRPSANDITLFLPKKNLNT